MDYSNLTIYAIGPIVSFALMIFKAIFSRIYKALTNKSKKSEIIKNLTDTFAIHIYKKSYPSKNDIQELKLAVAKKHSVSITKIPNIEVIIWDTYFSFIGNNMISLKDKQRFKKNFTEFNFQQVVNSDYLPEIKFIDSKKDFTILAFFIFIIPFSLNCLSVTNSNIQLNLTNVSVLIFFNAIISIVCTVFSYTPDYIGNKLRARVNNRHHI